MSERPNILFLLADDYGAWALGCAGNAEVKTPHLDRIAREGVRMTNCFCASPVCSPARASILTGKNPSQHGIHDWLKNGHLTTKTDLDDDLKKGMEDPASPWYYDWPRTQIGNDHAIAYLSGQTTYTALLAEQGYVCGLSGKWHVGDSFHPQAGFTFWKTTAMGGDNYYYPVMLEGGKMRMEKGKYVTDLIADHALEFLETRPKDKPFYLSVHFTAPHSPWSAMHHPAKYLDMYRDLPLTSTPNVPPHPWAPNGRKTKAEWEREKHPGIRFSGAHFGPIPETWQEHRRESLTGYYAAITAMDDAIGRILEYLDSHGLVNDTLVIFTGDNGMSMGHHGIYGKGNGTKPVNMYDSAVKVPCLMRLPKAIPPGRVSDAMVSHYDFFQTILDYGNVTYRMPPKMPGSSMRGVLEGKVEECRKDVVVFDEYGPCRMIRTHEWKLVLRYPEGPNELYHLADDPDEERNLYGKEGTEKVAGALAKRLDAWFETYLDPAFDGAKEQVRGGGQIDSHHFV
ncbi:MAG: sulfatase-like hydrolase/transferase [Sphaerochaetaceae bacterium]|nr:sulfatase-like hydrolase/transferase [Spirochaetales bacterium]MDY5500049.1 sulfatase-like hydrolase/transferase [Sphaerochaetaceae bacterium]